VKRFERAPRRRAAGGGGGAAGRRGTHFVDVVVPDGVTGTCSIYKITL